MFAQSREDVRETFCAVYRKMQSSAVMLTPLEQQLADVISSHPEYHALLADTELALQTDYTVERGETNPFLHMGMHLAILEQVSTDRPPGIRNSYETLASRYGASGAEHRMMECLGRILWEAQQNHSLPDEQAFLRCVKKIL